MHTVYTLQMLGGVVWDCCPLVVVQNSGYILAHILYTGFGKADHKKNVISANNNPALDTVHGPHALPTQTLQQQDMSDSTYFRTST